MGDGSVDSAGECYIPHCPDLEIRRRNIALLAESLRRLEKPDVNEGEDGDA